jgi:ABC-type nitrate/sulfonate/bicarbonate transport system ATPase subunit
MTVLSLKNIEISFEKQKKRNIIFRNFSQEFTSGIYTLAGESGCGKTTLMRAIAGLQEIDSGSITLNEKKVCLKKQEIYMMHQHYEDFPWLSVKKNVYMAYKARHINITDKERKETEYLLKRVGLEDQAEKKVGSFASEISGGQSQRLSFIMGLAFHPKVYMLDEPTSALDNKNIQIISSMLQEYQARNDAIIIVITHDNVFAKYLNSTKIMLTEQRRIS